MVIFFDRLFGVVKYPKGVCYINVGVLWRFLSDSLAVRVVQCVIYPLLTVVQGRSAVSVRTLWNRFTRMVGLPKDTMAQLGILPKLLQACFFEFVSYANVMSGVS